MSKLNWNDVLSAYPEVATLQDGQQINVNHIGCSAGTDTKARLFIKRDGDRLLGYCHHCAVGGAKGGAPRSHIRGGQANVVDYNVVLPQDVVYRHDMCNVHANVWLNAAGLTQEERDAYHIGWSPSQGRVILPVYSYDGLTLLAYQRRRVLPDDKMPKYLTTRRKDTRHPVLFGKQHRASDTVVIVEDIMSAIKVNRVAKSVALLGTTLPDWLLFKLAVEADRAVVWLDNDNAQVRSKQREIRRKLLQFMDEVFIVAGDKDPKLHSTDDIRNILTNYT